MAEAAWVLRPAARSDLETIWREGARQWGDAQADRYADALFSLFDLLAAFPDLARPRQEFTPSVRIHPSGSHLVIYQSDDQGVEIIRILHAHQDFMAYLSED